MEANKDAICISINCSVKNNIYAQLKIVMGDAKYFICFKKCLLDHQ